MRQSPFLCEPFRRKSCRSTYCARKFTTRLGEKGRNVMQLFTTCVEQLDLAAIQLHQNNSAYRRFALILIDNVVELLAHNHCKKVLQDNCYTRILPPRYPKAIRDDVLGRDFSKKMKFLHGLGLV